MSEPQRQNRYEISSALEHVRQIVAMCRDRCGQIVEAINPRPTRSIGIVGAGTMGAAIAIEHAAHSLPVVLMDTSPEALRRAAAMADKELAAREPDGDRNSPRPPIVYTLDDADLEGCDLVLESIVEKRLAKQAVYTQVEPHLADRTTLATNTSTIPIARLARGLADPSRFCGVHFCHPVRLRPLVEVIPGPATSEETVAKVMAHVSSLGKLPLVVADGPGFLVNRLLMSYLNAAMEMVIAGVPIQAIDAAMIDFGMPLGPLELLDEIGLDTALQSGVVLAEVFSQRSSGSELLIQLVKARQYGKKSGTGFYSYPLPMPNPSCERAVAAMRALATNTKESFANRTGVVEKLLAPMIAEAARMDEEGKVAARWHIDLAMIFGIGFPLWRGGPLWWADRSGLPFARLKTIPTRGAIEGCK